MQDDHIDMVADHIDIPSYPISITHVPYPYPYSYRYLIDIRYPISISHIDIPYRYPDHILSFWGGAVEPMRERSVSVYEEAPGFRHGPRKILKIEPMIFMFRVPANNK